MEKLKIGIVGCGGNAIVKHLPALMKLPDICEIVAFCDIAKDKAYNAAKKFGSSDAKAYSDYFEMFQNKSIDVVYILLPNVMHCPATVAAFEAGKHVMCEKPMAHTVADAQLMMNAWKKSGKQFTIGYQNRFRPEVQALYRACKADELGDIYFAKAHAIRRRGVPTWGVFTNKALQGGGPLIDIGTHALDLTLWMMDNYEPESVTGSVYYKLGNLLQATEGNVFGPWDPGTFEVEDSAFGMIKMKNGATIILEASWALNILDSKEEATTLCGTKAGAEIRSGMSYKKDELIINRGHLGHLVEEYISTTGTVAYSDGVSTDPGFLETKQWLEAIINGTKPLVDPEQAFVVTQILEAIYESAETGKTVYF
ncbi:MAG: Gfo/Idh/MocA family oxidoreductase [Prevotella sp.]|nr:Gfo/Idh/MocA family oxidoreductase [Prevotella sp.]